MITILKIANSGIYIESGYDATFKGIVLIMLTSEHLTKPKVVDVLNANRLEGVDPVIGTDMLANFISGRYRPYIIWAPLSGLGSEHLVIGVDMVPMLVPIGSPLEREFRQYKQKHVSKPYST